MGKTVESPRYKVIHARVTDGEKEALVMIARRNETSVATLVRAAIRKAHPEAILAA